VQLLAARSKKVQPRLDLESHVSWTEDLSLGVVHCQDGRVGLEELNVTQMCERKD
jgi:hypothetical protein